MKRSFLICPDSLLSSEAQCAALHITSRGASSSGAPPDHRLGRRVQQISKHFVEGTVGKPINSKRYSTSCTSSVPTAYCLQIYGSKPTGPRHVAPVYFFLRYALTLRKGSASRLSLATLARRNSRRSTLPARTVRRSYPSIRNSDFSGFCLSKLGTFSDQPFIERKSPMVCFPDRSTCPFRPSRSLMSANSVSSDIPQDSANPRV